MSDQHAAGPLPELTPEQEEEVRRLLAEARHDEPIPAAVADRLDAALADLTIDQPTASRDRPGIAPVIDLAARRRRRNAAALLTGAAAVIVAGFAVGQAIGTDDSPGSGSDSAVSADRGSSAGGKGSRDLTSESAAPTVPGPTEAAPLAPVTLSSAHLRRDVEELLPHLEANAQASPHYSAEADGLAACEQPIPRSKFGLGDLFPALFDGQPAVLALRPPSGGSRRADVLACDSGQPLGSVNLSLP